MPPSLRGRGVKLRPGGLHLRPHEGKCVLSAQKAGGGKHGHASERELIWWTH